jgi:predicted 3-demethylubiquinone-9 3-methyltransferase (glyoxalase superfamily)
MPTLTPFLWFDDDLEQAIEFYGSVFGDPHLRVMQRYPDGRLFVASFEVLGQRFEAMNAGPGHEHTDAFSLFVRVDGQEEVDHYWSALTADGGAEVACGWLKDRFGMSWQIIPNELEAALSDPDPEKAQYAMQAMLKQKKIVIAELTR